MSAEPETRPVLYGDRRRWGLLQADTLTLLPMLPDRSVDAVVTDPPYGIGFGGHDWDSGNLATGHGFTNWTSLWAREVLRVLRPGGYAAIFGAPRTMHRLVSGVEHAGLEVRDQVLWIYGSGMPKSRRIAGDLGTTLKPAYEPILLARAPLDGTTEGNRARWGTGVLDIGASRVRDEVRDVVTAGEVIARWPANLGLVHYLGCNPKRCEGECAVRQIDQQAGADVSRFFYAAKASRGEREAGLADQTQIAAPIFSQSGHRPRANVHPTVKPLSVMRWLVRLITPRYGVVLDPFTGSGSTGCAALLEDRQFIGVEREAEYIAIARRRSGIGPSNDERDERGRPDGRPVDSKPRSDPLPSAYRNDHPQPRAEEARAMTKAQQTYERIEALKTEGMSQPDAIRTLAEEYGQSTDSVRGAYYTGKKQATGEPSVPRTARLHAKRETTATDAIDSAITTLKHAITAIESEVEEARERAEEAQREYDAIKTASGPRIETIKAKIEVLSGPNEATAKPPAKPATTGSGTTG